MPPKKKKQPKNAFYFFMMDWKAEKEEQGQRFSGLKEISELCSEDWKNLPEHNVKIYKRLEKEAKEKDKHDTSNKYNALGVNFMELEKQKMEKEMEARKMYDEIETTLISLFGNMDSLIHHNFYLVHTNVYCYWGQKEVYIPCEVAISKFNLKDGVVDTYHVFPAPFTPEGTIPIGYKYEVRQGTESVHDIPEPSEFDRIEYDWKKIREDVFKFLLPKGGTDLPPLYTMNEINSNTNYNITAVINFFDNIANDSDVVFRVYDLALLFFKLYGVCQDIALKVFQDSEKAFPVEGVAYQQLSKDMYNFSPGLACDFHEMADHLHNCSLSFVKRWVFLICEFCCKALRIPLVPGHHCLATAKITSTYKKQEPPQSQIQIPKQPLKPIQSSSQSYPLPADGGVGASENDNVYNSGDSDDGAWCTVPKMRNLSLQEKKLDHSGGGAWSTVSKTQHGTKNAMVENTVPANELFIDRSKFPIPAQTRVFKTGQSSNVVSEILPDCDNTAAPVRLPISRGRGEMLAMHAANLRRPNPGGATTSFSSEDFPELGDRKPGRLAKPITSGWGRGFLKE